jgi:hypothetical protein
MGYLTKISTAVLTMALCFPLKGQVQKPDSLGLPGDNLNLYAVMDLFQQSPTLEDFEKALNNQDSTINNLDLDGDGYVDYITVNDNQEDDVHNIVLQVPVNADEKQDVAVFTVKRESDDKVFIQLTGDEALYGKDYIVEPSSGGTPNPGYTGNKTTVVNTTVVNQVAPEPVTIVTWPVIAYIYRPAYVYWHSPWYFGYYPPYWHPWRPHYWHYYYGYHYHRHYPYHYTVVHVHRYPAYNAYYSTRRSVSRTVNVQIEKKTYVSTYSRPDTRRDGESKYQSSYSGRNDRQATTVSGSNNRRSASSNTDKSVSTNSNRRSEGSGTNKKAGRTTSVSRETTTSSRSATSRRSGTSVSTGRTTHKSSASTTKTTKKETSSQGRREKK